MEHGGFLGQATLWDTIMADPCPYTFVQTLGMNNAECEPCGKPQTLGHDDASSPGRFINCNRRTALEVEASNRRGCADVGQGVYRKSLYLPLDFAVNQKLL